MRPSICERINPVNGPNDVTEFLVNGAIVSDPTRPDNFWIGIGKARLGDEPEPGRLSIFAPDFFLLDPRPWCIYDSSEQITREDLLRLIQTDDHHGTTSFEWDASTFSEFEALFQDIQARIHDRTLLKAVPFIERHSATTVDNDLRRHLLATAMQHAAGQPVHVFGLWTEDGDGILGVTPEVLFQEIATEHELNSVTTMALAGTRQSGFGSLLADPKEVAEHRIVIDGIVERLAPLGSVTVGNAIELVLPYLVHLYSPIVLTPSRKVAFNELVRALHPTAAIGAWPRKEGWQWLRSQPNAVRRGRYGAPFGVIPPDSAPGICLVAIRGAQWSPAGIQLLAGCGIVADSQVDREWHELNAKLDSVQEALGL